MKKGVAMAMVLMLALSMLAACAKGGDKGESGKGAASSGQPSQASQESKAAGGSEKVTIKFMMWADSASERMYEELINKFEADNPLIKVETVKTDINSYDERLTIALTGGGEVDAFPFKDTNMFVEYAANGRLPNLNDLVAQSPYDLSGIADLTEAYKQDGNIYGLSFRKDVWALFYNKQLFDDANLPYPEDLTWEQYSALAKQLTKGEGQDKVWGSFAPDWGQNWWAQANQAGANYMTDADLTPYVKALQWKKDLVDSGANPSVAQNKSTNAHYRVAFLSGKYAMVYVGSWFPGMLEQDKKDGKLNFEWDMTYLPHPEGVAAGTTMSNSSIHALAPDSKHKEEAFKFISFMSGAEGQRIIAKYQTPASSDPSVAEAYKQNFSFDINLNPIFNAIPVPEQIQTKGSAEITRIMGEEGDLALLGEISAEAAMANVERRRAEALK